MLLLLSAISFLVMDIHTMVSLYVLPDQWEGKVACFLKTSNFKTTALTGKKKVISIKINKTNS